MDSANKLTTTCNFIDTSKSLKFQAITVTIQKLADQFKDVVLDYEELRLQSEKYQAQCDALNQELTKKSCRNCTGLKEVVAEKDNVIQLVGSTLTKLDETKDFKLLKELFKILCGDIHTLTPPRDQDNIEPDNNKLPKAASTSTPKVEAASPSFTEPSAREDSVSEIEGTPTGRTSPIILSKKVRSRTTVDTTSAGEKKKSSNSWPTSEPKQVKLTFPTSTPSRTSSHGGGKMKQSRLNLVRKKPSLVVDLTCSPVLSQFKSSQEDREIKVQVPIKQGSLDNDETILPSPTSGPPLQAKYTFLYKSSSTKNSPCKLKRPEDLKIKFEDTTRLDANNDTSDQPTGDATCMEESINLLQPFKFPKSPKKPSVKLKEEVDENATQFDTNVSLSILQQVDRIENDAQKLKSASPMKGPLAENLNITNMPTQHDTEVSISVLQRNSSKNKRSDIVDKKIHVRKTPEKLEDIYKEPTVRKKAEKRALPGWSCEECKNFYSELYKDNEPMLLKLMDACSRHRGRRNPARPATPPGYWQPRWDMPTSTEEFNRRNNAD
ncbi:hypothetical protein JYU34_005983 [Plutella xylostella]|uniref:DNA endonuclease RBBP8 n=1 Tax=Plutella xylostella TaxID=51655 RepID=A0ABQ7QUN6_PLUXY|nr:hypothetical protein JYU34_005983 [Plutella xylostella]